MKTLEQFLITTLFILMIIFPFFHIMEKLHPKLDSKEVIHLGMLDEILLKKQQERQKVKHERIEALLPKNYSKQKKEFMHVVLPAVDAVYEKLQNNFHRIQNAIKNGNDQEFLAQQKAYYKVTSNEKLLLRAKPHPKSIAIAQAAIESAWATSRFYKIANNLFGVWSFNRHEPRVAAQGSREGQTIWLRKYDGVKASIEDYYKTISTNYAYHEFRQLQTKTSNPLKLAAKLHRYSEKGDEYAKLLTQIIIYNNFLKFDNTKL